MAFGSSLAGVDFAASSSAKVTDFGGGAVVASSAVSVFFHGGDVPGARHAALGFGSAAGAGANVFGSLDRASEEATLSFSFAFPSPLHELDLPFEAVLPFATASFWLVPQSWQKHVVTGWYFWQGEQDQNLSGFPPFLHPILANGAIYSRNNVSTPAAIVFSRTLCSQETQRAHHRR